jgi:ankyrin repeat protein
VNENGNTALMLAAYNGHTKIVQLLINNGANVNIKDKNNRTSLMFASSGPFAETVSLLIKNGAKTNEVDNVEGFTALMFAASEGNSDVVRVLLKNGADKSILDVDKESAYDFAIANQHPETANIIKDF